MQRSPFVLNRLFFHFTFAHKNALLSTKLPYKIIYPNSVQCNSCARADKAFLPFYLFGYRSNNLRLSLGDRLLCFDKNREIFSGQVSVQIHKRQVSKASTLKPAQLKTNEKNMQPADSDSWWTLAMSTGQLTQKKTPCSAVSRLYCYVHSTKRVLPSCPLKREATSKKKTELFQTLFTAASVFVDFEHVRSLCI